VQQALLDQQGRKVQQDPRGRQDHKALQDRRERLGRWDLPVHKG
jgi:hypothetical protein